METVFPYMRKNATRKEKKRFRGPYFRRGVPERRELGICEAVKNAWGGSVKSQTS